MNKTLQRSALFALVSLPALALAHGGNETSGLGSGLAHPLGGLDHILAMVAVGIWGASLGGHARWQLPLAFIVAMLGGGALGMTGFAVPGVEPMVLASSVVVGLALALAGRFNTVFAASLCAGFALFHGVAHGAEMPLAAPALGYAAGFTLATLALHGFGMICGFLVRALPGAHRVFGALIAAGGLALAIG